MNYKEYCKKVKECIGFLKYCEELRIRVVQEHNYYKDELVNENYDNEDIKAILYGTLNITERNILKTLIKFVDWYLEQYDKSHTYSYRTRFYRETDLLMLLLQPFKPDGVKSFYFFGWVNHFEKCYRPMKETYYEVDKEILISKNFVILNKLYELIQEIKNI